MKIYFASDHAAVKEKSELVKLASDWGHEVLDLGPTSEERTHYPSWAEKLVRSIHSNDGQSSELSRGVLLCGSGIGMSITANKFKGIRAALCGTIEEAKLSREHNDANVLCLGARTHSLEQLKQILEHWLKTDFAGDRHEIRVGMMNAIGQEP